MFADNIYMEPRGIIAWLLIGLIAGWLAGLMMKGSGFGIVWDIILGLLGSVVGGFVCGLFAEGELGFWGSVAISCLGACLCIGISRALSPGRSNL